MSVYTEKRAPKRYVHTTPIRYGCQKIDGADASPYGIGVRFIQKISNHQSHEELKRRSGLRQQAEIYLTKHTQSFRNLPPEDNLQLIHELQVHQMELEIQYEELRRTQMELAESRDKYHELYDFAPIGYFTFDDKVRIHCVNHSGANLLGIPKDKNKDVNIS